IKQVSRATEQVSDPAYFTLLHTVLEALNDATIPLDIAVSWFWLQLAILEGQGLNLATDVNGMKLVEDKNYTFDPEAMAFFFHENGEFTTEHIKLLRLLSAQPPLVAAKVKSITPLLTLVRRLAEQTIAR
ncbi:MAG TPA: hypothetical protein PKD68_01520, partial [Candidatus Saccharibacteria bacterium]|nr:hypothetical protein [Candidatus Saccharibacteria bacterium]